MNFSAEAKSNVYKYAQKRSKIIYATFESFVNDIKKTDFSKTDRNSIYEVRDMIISIADRHGIEWIKADTCCDIWQIAGEFKLSKRDICFYAIGFEVDYYEIPRNNIWSKLPQMILDKFDNMTTDTISKEIVEQILDFDE